MLYDLVVTDGSVCVVAMVPMGVCPPTLTDGRKASLAAFSIVSYICTFSAALSMLVFFSSPCSMSDCSCGSVNTSRQGMLPNDAVSCTASVSRSLCASRIRPLVFSLSAGRSYLLYTPHPDSSRQNRMTSSPTPCPSLKARGVITLLSCFLFIFYSYLFLLKYISVYLLFLIDI